MTVTDADPELPRIIRERDMLAKRWDGASLDDIGIAFGTDKASRVERGRHFIDAGRAHETHNYLRFYEQIMGHRRDDKIRILEIGVQYGYSIATWMEGFPYAEIHGIDRAGHWHADEKDFRAKFHECDVDNIHHARDVVGSIAPIDMLVEDGSHQSQQQKNLFDNLFEFVAPGGVYVIEDIGCGYVDSYGGNPRGDGSSIIQRMKDTIDDFQTHRREDIKAIHWFRDLVFIEKA